MDINGKFYTYNDGKFYSYQEKDGVSGISNADEQKSLDGNNGPLDEKARNEFLQSMVYNPTPIKWKKALTEEALFSIINQATDNSLGQYKCKELSGNLFMSLLTAGFIDKKLTETVITGISDALQKAIPNQNVATSTAIEAYLALVDLLPALNAAGIKDPQKITTALINIAGFTKLQVKASYEAISNNIQYISQQINNPDNLQDLLQTVAAAALENTPQAYIKLPQVLQIFYKNPGIKSSDNLTNMMNNIAIGTGIYVDKTFDAIISAINTTQQIYEKNKKQMPPDLISSSLISTIARKCSENAPEVYTQLPVTIDYLTETGQYSPQNIDYLLTCIAKRAGKGAQAAYERLPQAITTLTDLNIYRYDEIDRLLISIATSSEEGTSGAFGGIADAISIFEATINNIKPELGFFECKPLNTEEQQDWQERYDKHNYDKFQPYKDLLSSYLVNIAQMGINYTGNIYRNSKSLPGYMSEKLHLDPYNILGFQLNLIRAVGPAHTAEVLNQIADLTKSGLNWNLICQMTGALVNPYDQDLSDYAIRTLNRFLNTQILTKVLISKYPEQKEAIENTQDINKLLENQDYRFAITQAVMDCALFIKQTQEEQAQQKPAIKAMTKINIISDNVSFLVYMRQKYPDQQTAATPSAPDSENKESTDAINGSTDNQIPTLKECESPIENNIDTKQLIQLLLDEFSEQPLNN